MTKDISTRKSVCGHFRYYDVFQCITDALLCRWVWKDHEAHRDAPTYPLRLQQQLHQATLWCKQEKTSQLRRVHSNPTRMWEHIEFVVRLYRINLIHQNRGVVSRCGLMESCACRRRHCGRPIPPDLPRFPPQILVPPWLPCQPWTPTTPNMILVTGNTHGLWPESAHTFRFYGVWPR